MKKQIKRLSPHQNGKVFGILTAVASLVLVIPMLVFLAFAAPSVDQHGNPIGLPKFLIFVVLPIFYFVFTYVSVLIGSAIYNWLVKYIGGFEFEVEERPE